MPYGEEPKADSSEASNPTGVMALVGGEALAADAQVEAVSCVPCETLDQRLAREAGTIAHQFGHRTHNIYCKHCVRANAQRAPCKKGSLNRILESSCAL